MPTYITGHKNPDTDSIVSAIAYAALKNALGERDVIPVRLGEINNETMHVLDRFGFEPPQLIESVKTQLRDVVFDRPPIIGSGVTVRTAWDVMIQHNVQTVCIADENGKLVGTLENGHIAEHDMNCALSGFSVQTNAFNLATSIEGNLLGGKQDWDVVEGRIEMAVHDSEHITAEKYAGTVLISGERKNIIRLAEKAKVSCLILCEIDADSPIAKQAADANYHVILTHYDPYRAARLISHSVSVSSMMRTENITYFHIDDYLDYVREVMQKNRAASYPVLDENDCVLGTVTRYHLLNHKRKKVIIVDHNEAAQSVPGLEQAELLEIIDHHRLGDIQTGSPVFIRMEVVGSATTIVASMFFDYGVTPGVRLAGLIASAILSDTVMFKSPTCTDKDKRMAYRMAQLAGIDLNSLGIEIFSAASNIADNDPKTLLFQDYKEYTLGDHRVGIGQITCMDMGDLDSKQEALLKEMQIALNERKMDFILFMETEIVRESTRLLYVGDAGDVIRDAFNVMPKDSAAFLDNVMSRKKQIVPAISAVLA